MASFICIACKTPIFNMSVVSQLISTCTPAQRILMFVELEKKISD